jgi:hypothetical protein
MQLQVITEQAVGDVQEVADLLAAPTVARQQQFLGVRQLAVLSVPAETPFATGKIYQLAAGGADRRMRHAAQIGNRLVAPFWKLPSLA